MLALVEIVDEDVDLAARSRLAHEAAQIVLERRERPPHVEGQLEEALVDGLDLDRYLVLLILDDGRAEAGHAPDHSLTPVSTRFHP